MKSKKRIDNIPFVVETLLSLLGIPATSGYVEKILTTHPDYPSILAISEALHEWGIETEAAKGTIADLAGIDLPAIALLGNNKYVVLEAVSGSQVTVISSTKGKVNVPIDKFNDMWSGIVLQVVQAKGAQEKNYHRHRKEQFLKKLRQLLIMPGFFILIIVAFAGSLSANSPNHGLIPPGILKIAGLAACAVMFAGSTGKSHILSRICKFKEKLDCQRVLESPGGSILGISMVDMGLVYFSGGFLALLFSLFAGQTEQCLIVLAILNILVLPYTVFSLFYQAFVIRTWCLLCLLVQALFWSEFYFLSPSLSTSFDWSNWNGIIPTVFGFGLALLAWLTLRPIISKYPGLKQSETQALRLQNQPDFIQVQLAEVEGIDMGSFPFEIAVGEASVATAMECRPSASGDPCAGSAEGRLPLEPQCIDSIPTVQGGHDTGAPVTLTLVLNPLCRHCGETLGELLELVEIGRGKIKGVVRFLVGDRSDETGDEENSLDFDVACFITGLAIDGENNHATAALEKWFAGTHSGTIRFFKSWRRQYQTPNQEAMEKARKLLRQQREWAMVSSLHGTPVQYLYNLKLPAGMTFKNLKYFLIRKLHN
ncbi:MAG: hypothetical protein GY765_42510 [bacterium]|nr:hypothetical protein [bacterium]